MDIRQSPEYADFMRSIGWIVEKAGKWNVFIKKFSILGSLIKAQRINLPIPYKEIRELAKKYHAFKTILEFSSSPKFPIPPGFQINKSPFLPTKTILIDLKKSEKEIFDSFSEEKRRAIRKAIKNNILIKGGSAQDFIYLKRKSLLEKSILPIGDKKDVLALEKSFSPNNICFVIARNEVTKQSRPLAGILLLFSQKTAYYWQAASTKLGRKLSSPSFLVWEALKLSKKKGCEVFDFEGIYDERFPIGSWKGFTKFKQGFGGKEIVYPSPIFRKAIL